MLDASPCIASLVKISNHFDHISGGYAQKTTQKHPEMVLSAAKKTFEISKLGNYKSDVNETWHMYHLNTFHLHTNGGGNEWVVGGAFKKPSKNAMKLTKSWH